jgi:hypothetical protein
VTSRLRDVVVTGIALTVLITILLAINPQLREETAEVVFDAQFDTLRSVVNQVAASTFGTALGYAGDNTYLFTFLVAACVLVVLMVKVLL